MPVSLHPQPLDCDCPNVYLMLYPKEPLGRAIAQSPELKRQVWDFLNGIDSKKILNEGRVYGVGLHKLEPKELGRVPAAALADLLNRNGVVGRSQ